MTTVLALLGVKALYLTYVWLGSAITAAYLSNRKGYGERPGLAAGLLLTFVGVIIWLIWPARDESMWKTVGWRGSKVREVEKPTGYKGDASNS
jgi:hypothetical protein